MIKLYLFQHHLNSTRDTFLILLFFIAACTTPSPNKTPAVIPDSSSEISSAQVPDTIIKPLVSDNLFRIVLLLDSCGFNFDTTRFNKSYRRSTNAEKFMFRNFPLYHIEYNRTVPYKHIFRCENDTDQHTREWCSENNLEKKYFENVTNITQYFYITKTFHAENKKGYNEFPDGIVEEWEFPDSLSAKNAATNLALHEEWVYFNCTGFIFYKDNYMYVFHSRAINFMYAIRPYFKIITKELKGSQANKSLLND